MQLGPTSREELLEAILERAATDLEFRTGLLKHPRETVNQAFGVRVPDAYRIRFIERDPELDSLVVLPEFRKESEELSDEDLENVSGGGGIPPFDW